MAQQVLVAAGELDSEGDGVGMCVVPQGALCGPAHPTHHTGPYVDQQYFELCAVHMQLDCTQGCLVGRAKVALQLLAVRTTPSCAAL